MIENKVVPFTWRIATTNFPPSLLPSLPPSLPLPVAFSLNSIGKGCANGRSNSTHTCTLPTPSGMSPPFTRVSCSSGERDRHMHTHICTHMHTHICTHMHTHICTHMHTYACTHTHTYACTHMHTYIRMYMYMYICTYVYTIIT